MTIQCSKAVRPRVKDVLIQGRVFKVPMRMSWIPIRQGHWVVSWMSDGNKLQEAFQVRRYGSPEAAYVAAVMKLRSTPHGNPLRYMFPVQRKTPPAPMTPERQATINALQADFDLATQEMNRVIDAFITTFNLKDPAQ